MKIINSWRFFKNPDLEFHFHFENFPKTGPKILKELELVVISKIKEPH